MSYLFVTQLAAQFGAIGMTMMLFSLFSRAHRGVRGDSGLWARKESFTATEYAANRAGFVMSMIALAIMLLVIFLR